ncbi:MAG: hypothetical protein ACOC3G_07370 [Phycisphaeraceae bacterium]
MGKTYDAILEGDRLIWTGDRPAEQKSRRVRVVLEDETEQDPIIHRPTPEQKRQAYAAIERLRAQGGIKSIPDPSAWQREIRKDRPLPGREDD